MPATAETAAPAVVPWSRWSIALSEDAKGQPLCLALANTLHFRNSAEPRENLHVFGDLARWAVRREIWTQEEADGQGRAAAERPDAARRELVLLIELREAIARVFAAHAAQARAAPADVATVMQSFNEAARHLKMGLDRGRLVPWMGPGRAGFESPRWQCALSAVGLLGSERLARVKACADDRGCGWLFLDTTRNGSRMYCFSNECGNRARQVRYRSRR